MPGPARTTPDYDVLNLVDAVWGGGGFGTRLNLNLRENKAYSYGVFSNFNLMREAGNWTAAGGVQTDKTSESIVEFDKELKDLAGARPITNDELALAKQRRVRGYAQQFESLDRITGEIANLWAWGLPTAELQRAYDATSAVTLEQIGRGVEEVRAASAGVAAAGRRSRQNRGQGEVAEPRRDRPAGQRGQAGGRERRNEVGVRRAEL